MIAKNIRRLRQNKGISQKELAKAIHVTPSAISQYETGKSQPSRENMALLAAYFNVSVAYIEGTSTIEELEDQMNEEYLHGLTVSALVEKCLCVSLANRAHLVRYIEFLSNDSINGR